MFEHEPWRALLAGLLVGFSSMLAACSVVYDPDKLGAGCAAGTQLCNGKCMAPEAAAAPDQCGSLSCGPSEYEVDGSCVPLSPCGANEYESAPPSAHDDRICNPISDCEPGQYVALEPTAVQDRKCAACPSGTFSSASNAPECERLSVCAPGQFVAEAPTAVSDRRCSPCPDGSFSSENNESSCTPWSTCSGGQGENVAPTQKSDRVCGVAQASEFETGLWRLAARSSRLTLTRSSATGLLTSAMYTGSSRQQFRLRRTSEAHYELKIESTKECLLPSGSTVSLGACGDAKLAFEIESLRVRSEAQPALYRMHAPDGSCMVLNGSAAPVLGACSDSANWYLEPVGYGERSKPVEYELRGLLIVKSVTDSSSPSSHSTIPQDILDAGQLAFTRQVAERFRKMSDGRVRWLGESVVSPDPLTSLTEVEGSWVPRAENVPNDVSRYLQRGKYDAAMVFFLSRGLGADGGWVGIAGAASASSYTYWATVNGGDMPASAWLSGEDGPAEGYVWAIMSSLSGFFSAFDVPLPAGQTGAPLENLYDRDIAGWTHWYRDYLLGTVIAQDDTYCGEGPRAFRFGTPRAAALKH